jgi:hypothetical protein
MSFSIMLWTPVCRFPVGSRTGYTKLYKANRARVLSIYQLGLIAGAPIGSLIAGLMSGAFGPNVAISLAAGTMFTDIASIE